MKAFFAILAGATTGLFVALFTGKPFHDLIWSRDMEGDSGFFTFLLLAPLFAALGAVIAGCLFGGASGQKVAVCVIGGVLGAGAGLLFAIYGLRPFDYPMLLVPMLVLGGAVGGGMGAARLWSRRFIRG